MDWISVDDRLPEYGVPILYMDKQGSFFTAYVYPSAAEWFKSIATHWWPIPLPLPDPLTSRASEVK